MISMYQKTLPTTKAESLLMTKKNNPEHHVMLDHPWV